jgi:hypothetical protein
LRLAGLIFLALVASSCFDEGDCLVTNSNLIKVSLWESKDKKKAKQIPFTSIAIPGDTVLYANKSMATFDLPVDPGLNEMQYVLQYSGKTDTLIFRYNTLNVVHSPTCGAFPYQRNLEIMKSTFPLDSAVVVNQSLGKNVTENVKIYF